MSNTELIICVTYNATASGEVGTLSYECHVVDYVEFEFWLLDLRFRIEVEFYVQFSNFKFPSLDGSKI